MQKLTRTSAVAIALMVLGTWAALAPNPPMYVFGLNAALVATLSIWLYCRNVTWVVSAKGRTFHWRVTLVAGTTTIGVLLATLWLCAQLLKDIAFLRYMNPTISIIIALCGLLVMVWAHWRFHQHPRSTLFDPPALSRTPDDPELRE